MVDDRGAALKPVSAIAALESERLEQRPSRILPNGMGRLSVRTAPVETCTLRHPLPFTFFVGVYGASDFGGATLTLTYG